MNWNNFWIAVLIFILLGVVITLSIIINHQNKENTEIIVQKPICQHNNVPNQHIYNEVNLVSNNTGNTFLDYIKSKTDLSNLAQDFSTIDPALGWYLFPGWVIDMQFNNSVIKIKYGSVTNINDCIYKRSSLTNTYTNKDYGFMPLKFRRCIANCKPWAILTRNDRELCKNQDGTLDQDCCLNTNPSNFMPRTALTETNFKAGGFILPIKNIPGANQFDMYYFSIEARAMGFANGKYLQIYTGNSTWYTLYPALNNNWQTVKTINPVTWNINANQLLNRPRIRIKKIEQLYNSGNSICSIYNNYNSCRPLGDIEIEIQKPKLYQMKKIRPLWGKIKFACEIDCTKSSSDPDTTILNDDIKRCWIEILPNQWRNTLPEWIKAGAKVKLVSPKNSAVVFQNDILIGTVYPKHLDISINNLQSNIQDSNNLYPFYPERNINPDANFTIPLRVNFQDNQIPIGLLNNSLIRNFKQNLLPIKLNNYDVIIVPNDFTGTDKPWYFQTSLNSFCFDNNQSLVESYLCYNNETKVACTNENKQKAGVSFNCSYKYVVDGNVVEKKIGCPNDLDFEFTKNKNLCSDNQGAIQVQPIANYDV